MSNIVSNTIKMSSPSLPREIAGGDLSSTDGSIMIGAGVEFKGDVTVPGLAAVNGTFIGTLKAKDLIVGESGCVSGQISVETAEIRGEVSENLVAQSKVTLRASGRIFGSLTYAKITVEEGGLLTGKIEKISEREDDRVANARQVLGASDSVTSSDD